MASASFAIVTPRDLYLFRALLHGPLTVEQILKVSRTFPVAFTSARRVQERLLVLTRARLLNRFRYATTGQGTLHYVTLTHESFRLVTGSDEVPEKGLVNPVGLSRQEHTRNIADVVVHLTVAAHRAGIVVENFRRENTVKLQLGSDFLAPDASFQLRRGNEPAFSFFMEMDNATETIRSAVSLESWQQKIDFYERYQDTCPTRFRVLVITTGGEQRLRNILGTAKALARNPKRSLLYGIRLRDFLATEEPLTAACFWNHMELRVGMVPGLSSVLQKHVTIEPHSTSSSARWNSTAD